MGKNSKKKGQNKGKKLNNDQGKGKNQDPPEEVESRSSDDSSNYKSFIIPKPNSIIVGNLSEDVDTNQLWIFFHKQGGIEATDILHVRLDTYEDGTCRGTAQIEFATAEAVNKACQLSGRVFFRKSLTVNFGHEQRTISLDSSSLKKPHDFSATTVLITGFDTAYDKSMMRQLLLERFRGCGMIIRNNIRTDLEIGASIGVMFIEFRDQSSMSNALLLNGSELGGCCLKVEEAQP